MLLVVSLLTVKSDRRELVDEVRRGVISEGPKDEGGLLHWSRGVVVGLLGSWVPTDAILLIRAPDCYPVVVDWWKIRWGMMQNRWGRGSRCCSTNSCGGVSGFNGISLDWLWWASA